MSDVRVPLVPDEYYHVFNRGVARNPIFLTKHNYEQAMLTMSYYTFSYPPVKLSRFKEFPTQLREDLYQNLLETEKLVDILSFVFMPNHFHFLLKQKTKHGVSDFISKFTNSYTRYFNTYHQRVGPLFQGLFKAVHIESDEQLIHLSRYIHINPTSSIIIPNTELFSYKWSSLPIYLGTKHSSIIETQTILEHFPSQEDYKQFILDQIDYAKNLEILKHLTIEKE